MLTVGLTGGIGSGKSTASRYLASLGAVVIDADAIAREALAPGTAGLEAVEEAFGSEVIREDGTLDRAALARIVFDDAEAKALLDKIVHPQVYQESTRLQRSAPYYSIVVNDVPLIIESGVAARYHLVIVVSASESKRVSRVVAARGMSDADVRARIKAQAADSERKAVADVWLRNEGTEEDLEKAIEALWWERLIPFNENLVMGQVAPAAGEVVPPRREWPVEAERLANRIRFFAGSLARDVRHVGPTAQGLPAADVLDLEVHVRDAGEAELVRPALISAGFPAEPGIPNQHGSADPGRPARVFIRTGGVSVRGSTYR
jgi:dephospho-CoA kinase